MNKFKIFSIAFLTATAVGQAQDLDPAKKALDAEQYEKAKGMLKSIIQAKPTSGKALFLLGTIYLYQNSLDSAKVVFEKGLTTPDGGKFNNIGLAQIDLDNNNAAGAQSKFDMVSKDIKRKDIEEYIYIAKAYMNAEKPDFKKAITVLNKAKEVNPTDSQVQLALGDAYYGDHNQNDSYSAYRNAYQADNSLIRAKMQLGVLLKGAKAYTEAVKAYDEVIASNANYGPVYRELAETYYLWANNQPKTYAENIQKALGFYEKYLTLTDYSLTSRMRHADFLILAKDYKALEVEAEKMKQLDKVNPRILRYLGYAAYQNGNNAVALQALTDFTTKGQNKIIARDYLYLGLTKIQQGISADGKTVDQTAISNGIVDIKKALEMEPLMANELNEVGKKYFGMKLYGVAGSLFENAITVPASKNFIEDNVYYGLCVYTINKIKDEKSIDKTALMNADKAMDNVILASPTYQEAYLYKARINNSLKNDEVMAKNYQLFIDVVTVKGDEEITKNKGKFIESYNNMASFYANSDKAKAKELLNKTLVLDPANVYAIDSLKLLK